MSLRFSWQVINARFYQASPIAAIARELKAAVTIEIGLRGLLKFLLVFPALSKWWC